MTVVIYGAVKVNITQLIDNSLKVSESKFETTLEKEKQADTHDVYLSKNQSL